MSAYNFFSALLLVLALNRALSSSDFDEIHRRAAPDENYSSHQNGAVEEGYSYPEFKPAPPRLSGAEEYAKGRDYLVKRAIAFAARESDASLEGQPAGERTADRDVSRGEAEEDRLSKRQWNQHPYNKADVQRQIDMTRQARDNCYTALGWNMPPPPPPAPAAMVRPGVSSQYRLPYWGFPVGDWTRKKRAYSAPYLAADAIMLNDLRSLQTQLTACEQAARATTTTVNPLLLRMWQTLAEAARLLQWCITLGGRSAVIPDLSNIKSYDTAKLEALYGSYVREHRTCMASIGREPNGDFITKPPTTTTTTTRTTTTPSTTTTTRPTTTTPTTTTTRPTTTTPTTTATTTTTSTTTTTTPTTTTTTASTTTTTIATTTAPGLFTTTIPMTTLC